jgi:hypothetical protein
MARPVLEKTIDGVTYRVTLLGAQAGQAMSVKLLKLMGPSLASFIDGTIVSKSDGFGSLALGAADALRELTKSLTPESLKELADELARNTTVRVSADLEPRLIDIYDDHFAGHYDRLLGWLRFALEVNFRSFFAGSAVAREQLMQQLTTWLSSLSKSPQPSTGSSTESPQAAATPQA